MAADAEAARAIKRRGNLDAAKDYLAFAVNTISGLGLSLFGWIAYLAPHLLSTTIQHPLTVAGAGATLLAGPQVVRVLLKILPMLAK